MKNKILSNAKWILLCKVAQALLQMAIGMLTARYLGPSNYGLIGYAGSIVAFTLPLMQLGFQSTLIQELVETPEREGEIMGTAMVMELASAVCCFGLVCLFTVVANAGETQAQIVCALYALSLFIRVPEIMNSWFQYKFASKYPSIVMLIAYVVVSIYRIYLLATGKGIYWFAVVNSVEFAVAGPVLFVIYRRLGAQAFSVSAGMGKRLFARSKYYILSAMMVTVFQNTDHIMLKMISGDIQNGFYTAAVTCSVICQFVYLAITDSARPVILASRKESIEVFHRNISRLFAVTTYMTFAQAAAFTVLAEWIIGILYGQEFAAAVPVLRIIVWQISFAFMGSVRNMWILAEGKQQIVWKLNLSGAVINVVLNALMIPAWGACGAAAASLVTQVFVNFVLGFLYTPLRENNRLLLQGLNPRLLVEMLCGLIVKETE